MNDIKLFQITEEDKAHYKNIIKDIDTNHKDVILKFVEKRFKLCSMMALQIRLKSN